MWEARPAACVTLGFSKPRSTSHLRVTGTALIAFRPIFCSAVARLGVRANDMVAFTPVGTGRVPRQPAPGRSIAFAHASCAVARFAWGRVLVLACRARRAARTLL